MTTNSITSPEHNTQPASISRLLWVAPLAMAISSILDLGLYYGAGTLLPEVTAWPGAGLVQIVGANIVYLLIAAAIFAIVTRVSSRPARHYLIIATIGLLLSLLLAIGTAFGFGPPAAPPASMATVIVLSLMHVVSFAVSAPLFIRLALDQE